MACWTGGFRMATESAATHAIAQPLARRTIGLWQRAARNPRVFILLNLLTDLMYAWVDPRVSYGN
jgi:hypothetical protein